MVRVLVHAGFHKTGTSSLQDFLKINRTALSPWFISYGKADFRSAGAHARRYGERPFPWRRAMFRRALRRFLRDVPDDQNIVLTRETFSGGMPGHRRALGGLMTGYAQTAVPLAHVIVQELHRRFGPQVDITFFYTLRDKDGWIASVHGHLLRSIRLRDDFKTFRARFPDLKGPSEEARVIARALAPVPVKTAALEEYSDDPAGCARVILDHFTIPSEVRAHLCPAPRSNVGQSPQTRQAFLDLNRRIRDKAVLKRQKEDLLRNEGRPR